MEAARELDVIDDDEVSRELISLLAVEAGFAVRTVPSGDAELDHLRTARRKPLAILADLNMPGTTGNELAEALRVLCGAGTRLIAISAKEPAAAEISAYDGFLQKPFDVHALTAGLEPGLSGGAEPNPASSSAEDPTSKAASPALDLATYTTLAQSMSAQQLRELFNLCISDCQRRVDLMRLAVERNDQPGFHSGAHAIKGGCSMIGAQELAHLAGELEAREAFQGDELGALEEMMDAAERLRRILERASQHTSASPSGEQLS